MPSKLKREREREREKHCHDDITAATFIQSCWRRLLARKELQRLPKKAKELSIQLVGDSRTNHLEEKGNDTIEARSNSDFYVKSATIQFYSNNNNSQSDRWIGLKCYVESPDMFSYLGLNSRSIRVREGISIRVNRGCTDFVIYILLTRGLPIWLGFVS
jgi:hypothetical protein